MPFHTRERKHNFGLLVNPTLLSAVTDSWGRHGLQSEIAISAVNCGPAHRAEIKTSDGMEQQARLLGLHMQWQLPTVILW